MQDLEVRKFHLIKIIANVQNEYLLMKLEEILKEWKQNDIDFDLLAQVSKPMLKDISVEDLVKEQNYQGIDRVHFDTLVAEINIEEPIDQLLLID
jgi:hypothetical protein